MSKIDLTVALPRDEHVDVTLLAITEIMVNAMADRAKPNSRRHNRIKALQEHVERVNETFHGHIHPTFVGKAEHLYKTIEAGLNFLMRETMPEEPTACGETPAS